MICKECFEKQYGRFPELYYRLSKKKDICYKCGKKKQLIERRFNTNTKKAFIILD